MCGIAGLIHKTGNAGIGQEMTKMLQALKHRGPDSTGYALYGEPKKGHVVRINLAEQAEANRGFHIHEELKVRRAEVEGRMQRMGATVTNRVESTEYAQRYEIDFSGDLKKLIDFVEDVEGVEVMSCGHGLELIKDLGDASVVSGQYDLNSFMGTHAIGHTRMATESDVDIRSAHPYWAYPFNDVSVVHNGQLTNYWTNRRALEREGNRFNSNCDSELIAVYIANRIAKGDNLEEAMHRSINELDGVFTYLVATSDALGMAKDVMAAKPMVLYESDEFIAMASEEVSIRSIFPNEIDTFDPYEGEVRVWQK